MDFDFKNAAVFQAIKREKFPLFRFAKILKNIFLILFLASFLPLGFSFINLASGYSAARMLIAFLSFYLLFWNLHLFTETKIKKPIIWAKLSDAVSDLDSYNLAEFLGFNAAKIVDDSIKFCKKRKLSVSSTALFYSAVKISKDIALVSFRLGLDVKKLETDLKNYLEKMPKQPGQELFSEDFQKIIKYAMNVSSARGHNEIGEKEIFVALAKNDEFFKKVLIGADLKAEDVENLTLWLDSAEDLLEKNRKFWTYENLLSHQQFWLH